MRSPEDTARWWVDYLNVRFSMADTYNYEGMDEWREVLAELIADDRKKMAAEDKK